MTTGVVVRPGQVAAAYAQPVIEAAQAAGIALQPDPRGRSPADEALASDPPALDVAVYLGWMQQGASRRPDFGLEVGRRVRPATFPVLSHTVMACATLEEVLQQVLRFEHLNHDLGRSRVIEQAGLCGFVWEPSAATVVWDRQIGGEDSPALPHLVVSVFAGIASFSRWLFADPVPFSRLELQRASPELAEACGSLFGCPVESAQSQNCLWFDRSILSWRVQTADRASLDAMTRYAHQLLTEREQVSEGLRQRIRDWLSRHLSESPGIEALARELNVGPRTLQRRLKAIGTSYQAELEAVRMARAREWLLDRRLTIGEVAFRLGYQEQSSFNHAFRERFGRSPSEFREAPWK